MTDMTNQTVDGTGAIAYVDGSVHCNDLDASEDPGAPGPSSSFVGDGFFQDDFSSEDMSKTTNGFHWGGKKGTDDGTENFLTSVVKRQPDGDWYTVYSNTDRTSGSGSGPSGEDYGNHLSLYEQSDYNSISGDTFLRFRTHANVNESGEQGFYFDTPQPEIWIAYWLRLPIDWTQTVDLDGKANNKFFNIWSGAVADYNVESGTRFGINYWPNSASEVEDLRIQLLNNPSDARNNIESESFFTKADEGRWMHLIYKLKCSTSTDSTDAEFQLYRRWQNESGYTQLMQSPPGQIMNQHPDPGLTRGYIMGWTNRYSPVEAEFCLDNFEVSLTKPDVLP